jgi:hypothetical protein
MTLSIISQFRDEARFLKEWIEFHLLIGVDKFYLTDHLSTDNPYKILKPYIENGTVILERVELETMLHVSNHLNVERTSSLAMHQSNKFANISSEDWFIFLNVDEFMFPKDGYTNIKEYLKSVPENVGSIGICNKAFGHNNYTLKEGDILIEKLVMSGSIENPLTDPHHCHVKSIIRRSAFEFYRSPHFAEIKEDYDKTDVIFNKENIHPDKYRTLKLVLDNVRINHYRWRDLTYSAEKLKMYRSWGQDVDHEKMWIQVFNETDDYEIHSYLPKLKEKLSNHI